MAIPMHEARLDMDLEQLALHQQVAGILDVHPDSIADWHINRIRDDGAIDAEVPLTTIDVEGVPTDPRNVEELIKRFDKYEQEVGGTGQRDAVVIGHVPGEAFYMVDGFHRHEVQTLRGKPALHATVEPNLTYEQVVKRRLEYARTHAEIEFARQVDWIQSAWERTPMSEQIPNVLTAFRAFQEDYAHYKTDDVEQIDALSEQEYATVCEWVAQSSRDWGYTPREIRENLARAESFDPELMQLVYQKKGVPPEGRIGLGHVEAITETYPGEFDFQQEIVSMVIDHQLSVAQTKILIDKIEAHSPSTLANLQKVVKGIDISNIRAEGRTKYSSRGSSTGKAKVDTDYGLLNAIRGRLDDMQTAALEENRWATPEANAALDVIVGLSVIIVGLSEADEPVIDQKALHEAATIFDRLAKDLGKLSLSPETPQDINKKDTRLGDSHLKNMMMR